jgi:hypothetical protein
MDSPPRPPHTRLPLLYFGLAHAALAAAFAAVALWPSSFVGFFYHPKMVAVVHLITLGWISASILGALPMILPMAFRTRFAAGRLDFLAWGAYALAVVGMVGHFWLDSPAGMVWSAGLATAALLTAGVRALAALRPSKVPREVKLHLVLAVANVALAAGLGVLLGLNKIEPFLGGFVLTNVYAHAHLAAVGWAMIMVMGAGYRLLPMLLPSAVPEGRLVLLGAVLVEAGVLGLAASLLARSRAVGPFALLAVAGIGVFLSRVLWMRRHPRPAPKALRRPDWGVLHAVQALGWLALAAALGLALALSPPAAWKLRLIPIYGTAGLVGFLAQIVVGVGNRLLPLYAWMRAYESVDFAVQPPSPHATPVRGLQASVFFLWTAGVPLLAAGLGLERPAPVAAGGAALLLAVVLGGLGHLLLFRRARPDPPLGEPGTTRRVGASDDAAR